MIGNTFLAHVDPLRSVQALFAANPTMKGGVWLADKKVRGVQNAYQNAAGTTQVTAAGQTVGLSLDASMGFALEQELLENYDFSSGAAGWTSAIFGGASFAGSAGLGVLTTGDSGARVYRAISTVVGATYRVTIAYAGGTSPTWGYRITTDATGGATGQIIGNTGVSSSVPVVTFVFVATSVMTVVALICASSIGLTAQYDTVSVRKLKGANAIQATDANRPTHTITPSTGIPWANCDSSTKKLTATFPSALGASCTVVKMGCSGPQIIEGLNYSAVSTFDVCDPYGPENFGRMLFDRALTASEKARCTRLAKRYQPRLSAELFVNGDFSTNDGWALTSNWEISSGAARKPVGASGRISQIVATTNNSYFLKHSDVIAGGALTVYNAGTNIASVSVTNNYKIAFIALGTEIGFRADGSFSGTIDNASAKEIL